MSGALTTCLNANLIDKGLVLSFEGKPSSTTSFYVVILMAYHSPTSALRHSLTSIILWSSEVSGTSPLHRMMTVPVVSMPRRPARPAIWMYSPASKLRWHVPSCFRTVSKTTVRAGMFTPIAKVSVANRIWWQRKGVN